MRCPRHKVTSLRDLHTARELPVDCVLREREPILGKQEPQRQLSSQKRGQAAMLRHPAPAPSQC